MSLTDKQGLVDCAAGFILEGNALSKVRSHVVKR